MAPQPAAEPTLVRRRRPRRRRATTAASRGAARAARDNYQVRKFLNTDGRGSIALVYGNFNGDGGSLTVGDCSRQITLELGCYGEEATKNTQYKIDLLYEVVSELRRRIRRVAR